MKTSQIINKIESGKFPKEDLSKMLHAIAVAFDTGNYDKK